MSDWVSRKQFRVTNSLLSAATDYQIRFQVYRSTGTDTATDVYIGTNCQEDFSDIRWTDSTGIDEGLYEYWIESPTTSAVATCWVKMRYLPANSATTVYLYYNNPNGVSAYSSGSNTFQFFDDFNDLSAWTETNNNGDTTVADSIATHSITGSGAAYTTMLTSDFECDPTNTVVEGLFKVSSDGRMSVGYTKRAMLYDTGNDWMIYDFSTGGAVASNTDGSTPSTSLYKKWKSIHAPASVTYYYDDTQQVTTSSVTTDTGGLVIQRWYSGVGYSDWVLIRKYLATEPTVEVVESGDTNTTTTKAYRIVGLEFDQDTGLFTIEFGAVEDYYMSQDAKYRGAYDTSLSLM